MSSMSANDAWTDLLADILEGGVEETPRGKLTKELIGLTTKFDMSRPIITVANRKLGYKFLAAEAWWIIKGSNRVDEIAPYSKMISNFSDDGLTFRGAYGPQIQDQLPWVAEQLAKDPFTRQAVLSIWRPRPGPSKDYPCTLGAQWLLREVDKQLYLHCQVTMRSSDAWLGVPYDWFNFSMQTAYLIAYMRTAYPGVFFRDIHVGTLTFTAGSQHLYEDHFEAARACVLDPEPTFEYVPLDPFYYQADPYMFQDHLKSLADRNPDISELGGPGCFEELYTVSGPKDEAKAKLGFDADNDPRGLNKK